MSDTTELNLDEETIARLGLKPSDKAINAHNVPNARIFEYPGVENIFIMEYDLYGNPMPKGSCFLAFNGRNGLIGKHLAIEQLRHSSVAEIQSLVESNTEG